MKRGNKIRSIIIIIAIGLVSYYIVISVLSAKEVFESRSPDSYKLDSEMSNLVSPLFMSKVSVEVIRKSKLRRPVAYLFYDESYLLEVFEFDFSGSSTRVSEIVKLENRRTYESSGNTYSKMSRSGLAFSYLGKLVTPVEKVILSYSHGPVETVLQSDSLLAYNLYTKNFGVRYSSGGPTDIVCSVAADHAGTAMAFLKRGRKLFIMLFHNKNVFERLSSKEINDIFKLE